MQIQSTGDGKMSEAVIDGVRKIANHLYKQRGYVITIKREEVATVLKAFLLLSERIKEDNNE